MATQVLIIFVIRSARAGWRDRPSALLALSFVGIVAVAVALLAVTELAKRVFYRLDLSRRTRPAPMLATATT